MNLLTHDKRVSIVTALVEGNSMRATARMAGVSVNTVMKLVVDMGEVCQAFHDQTVVAVAAERVQADEVWSFCYAKQKNLPDRMRDKPGVGSIWTFTALDSDSKLMLSWHLGDRDTANATVFMRDLASRLCNRIQLTTDGWNGYQDAVYAIFGMDIDYAQLMKHYASVRQDEARYSPASCTGTTVVPVIGSPVEADISTSHVERTNLTLRMGNRRFTRLTNAFSRKLSNLSASVSLFFTYYNFCRVHKTLRETPAMRAGIATKPWTVGDLVCLLEAREQEAIVRGEHKRGKYRPRKSA